MKSGCVAAVVIAMSAAVPVSAAADDMADMKDGQPTMSAQDAALTDAEVTRIDAGSGRVTLKHGALRNVGMPPMTMAFKAADPAMLGGVHVGDHVKVRVERVNGTLTIVKLVNVR
ncbi:copper-binding protein [Burkholderia multivorans]|uniref:copper-binding protein n=1 Tax=Burkholderia multivorans TaxID=87883 RepID=UPI0007582DFF|nr:copper-binding protein [Burkholderia multivorans]KVZ30269.1 RND transporter MFP subunit [Burkholderia multivorans]MCA8334848.1 copper-binding protein [Burkholderia multivorans]MDN7475378.1 copper-binding protein [Burkholderia multivorans]PRE05983.1 RND transporter MFP subunit [Burkholderia multivorans]UXZ63826.1 copper-binding protein [Burkholderia multivorans]